MTAIPYDVLGLGNAIVDVITRADDAFLVEHHMRKGGMALIDEARRAGLRRQGTGGRSAPDRAGNARAMAGQARL
jgi:hypothetical protein